MIRPAIFRSGEKCFVRACRRGRFGRTNCSLAFIRSGRSGSAGKILEKLRLRIGCPRKGLIHIVGNRMFSINISLETSSPACNG